MGKHRDTRKNCQESQSIYILSEGSGGFRQIEKSGKHDVDNLGSVKILSSYRRWNILESVRSSVSLKHCLEARESEMGC